MILPTRDKLLYYCCGGVQCLVSDGDNKLLTSCICPGLMYWVSTDPPVSQSAARPLCLQSIVSSLAQIVTLQSAGRWPGKPNISEYEIRNKTVLIRLNVIIRMLLLEAELRLANRTGVRLQSKITELSSPSTPKKRQRKTTGKLYQLGTLIKWSWRRWWSPDTRRTLPPVSTPSRSSTL